MVFAVIIGITRRFTTNDILRLFRMFEIFRDGIWKKVLPLRASL